MLSSLHINNFALIDDLNMSLTSGLTIITGETGAGKSIILGAIDLLCGRRADTKVLRNKERKALVEADFEISTYKGVKDKLQELDYEVPADGHLIMRREISPSGRSRAFINDTPANLQAMAALSSLLLDVHSQHQTQAIVADPKVRLRFLDSINADTRLRDAYKDVFRRYVKVRQRVHDLRQTVEADSKERSMLEFNLSKLVKLQPKIGEQKELDARYDMQSRSLQIKEKLDEAISLLAGEADSASERMERSLSLMRRAQISALTGNGDDSLENRLSSIIIELKDIAGELVDIDVSLDNDPEVLRKLEERLNDLYEAQIYFKVRDPDELVALKNEFQRKLDSQGVKGRELPELEREMRRLAEELKEAAASLTEERKRIACEFSEELAKSARNLGLPNLKFKADVVETRLSADGADQIDFLCAFNKNQPYMQLQDTASGGEASRLMLSMKAIIAGKTEMPTLIFDEIDTGISGEIASKAGRMMKEIGERIQVLAITHLPQVAVAGSNHFKVYKQDTEKETVTNIKKLTREERKREIAKMLSGSVIDEAALQNAEFLMNEAQSSNNL